MRLAALILALLPLPLAAQDCGPPDSPCRIDGGYYHVTMPEAEPRGAVVFLHGWGGRADGIMRNTGLMRALTERGYAAVAVQGMPRREGDNGGAWNSRAMPAPRRDDVGFIDAVADSAAERFNLPRDNFVLGGFSGGGMMTWRVACDAPGAFAAYAPIAGTFWRPIPDDCAEPVRLHHTHGTDDDVVPLEGRTVGSGITQGDVFDVMEMQRALHGCTGNNAQRTEGIYRIDRWTNCADGDLVMALHEGGHSIPRGWANLMLDWFEDS